MMDASRDRDITEGATVNFIITTSLLFSGTLLTAYEGYCKTLLGSSSCPESTEIRTGHNEGLMREGQKVMCRIISEFLNCFHNFFFKHGTIRQRIES